MRGAAIVAVALAVACRIPNETFSLVTDGSVDAASDGPSPPVGFVYVADKSSGIYVFTRTAAGALALAPITQPQPPVNTPLSAVANAAGTKLYVLSHNGPSKAAVVEDYAIGADGSLTAGGSIALPTGLPTPSPLRIALSPNEKFIAVAVQTTDVDIIKLANTGALVSVANQQFAMLTGSSTAVEFSHDTNCIYVTSGDGFVGANFSAGGSLSGTSSIAGPAAATAIAVDPVDMTILIGGGSTSSLQLHGYAANGCSFMSNVTATLMTAGTPYALLLDHANHRLYAPGAKVAVFDVTGDTASNGRTGVAQTGTATTGGAAIDDHGIVYVSAPGYTDIASGNTTVVSVTLDGDGLPTPIATAALPVSAQPASIALAPMH